jgi:hypothetical protein
MHTIEARDIRPTWEPRPYSKGQADLIKAMCSERDITPAMLLNVFPTRPTTFAEAGKVIEWLKGQTKAAATTPSPAPSAQAPVDLATYRQTPGKKVKAIRYALRDEDGTVKFYRVKPGAKSGFFFVDVQASDDLSPVRNYGAKTAILARIANDPDAALALYGQELGSCGHCGRTLTSEYRKLGIGPVCINK